MTGFTKNLLDRVLSRLGFGEPPVIDAAGLQRLYASWCMHVPFDNLRKMIVLNSAETRPMPGMNVADFFENWLKNGSGATCWPMANAFYDLLSALGYDAIRVAASMRDMGIINHGSVKVSFNGLDYLADASLLLNVILPLDHSTFIHNDPVFPVESEPDVASHLVWMLTPPGNDYFTCRIIGDQVGYSLFEDRYEASRERSIFNQRLYARRNYPGELIILWGNTRFSKTAKGVENLELSRDELCNALHRDIGISENLINEWIASGCLDASFEPFSGQPPPAVGGKPPSQR
ncbi:MAG: arylamine N-acetyltransferase [Bacteroidales bacterium]|nr:arylamine N-acetyltransferase [Bacteroidales bacterium]